MTEAGAIRLGEGTVPVGGGGGTGFLYFDQVDGNLYFKNSTTGLIIGPISGGAGAYKYQIQGSGSISGTGAPQDVWLTDHASTGGNSLPYLPLMGYRVADQTPGGILGLNVQVVVNTTTQVAGVDITIVKNTVATVVTVNVPPLATGPHVSALGVAVAPGDLIAVVAHSKAAIGEVFGASYSYLVHNP